MSCDALQGIMNYTIITWLSILAITLIILYRIYIVLSFLWLQKLLKVKVEGNYFYYSRFQYLGLFVSFFHSEYRLYVPESLVPYLSPLEMQDFLEQNKKNLGRKKLFLILKRKIQLFCMGLFSSDEKINYLQRQYILQDFKREYDSQNNAMENIAHKHQYIEFEIE